MCSRNYSLVASTVLQHISSYNGETRILRPHRGCSINIICFKYSSLCCQNGLGIIIGIKHGPTNRNIGKVSGDIDPTSCATANSTYPNVLRSVVGKSSQKIIIIGSHSNTGNSGG